MKTSTLTRNINSSMSPIRRGLGTFNILSGRYFPLEDSVIHTIRALASAPQTFQIGRSAPGPKGRGLLSTLTKIVRTIHNHLYMKIIRSLHFCKFASAHYIKIQRNRKMSIFRFSFGD